MNKPVFLRRCFLTALLLLVGRPALTQAAQSMAVITVDVDTTIKENIRPGAAGLNLCWLLDSDRYWRRPISMHEALAELGAGSLRFPYGHLADNYLWHTPPFDEPQRGLPHRVASRQQAPAHWSWAVQSDGSFKTALDFNEFMGLCDALNIKPLVVVNTLSCFYPGGPTYDDLKETAIAWVRYAHDHNYHVAYWQIGNEVDHHPDLRKRDTYVNQYQDYVSAMKQVDPTIKVGPGILSSTAYFNDLMKQCPHLVDFVSAHQYMYKYIETCQGYERWRDHVDTYTPNISRMQKAVANSVKPDMDIVVTETGVTPANKELGTVNNTYKALWWFEVLMNELSIPNVAYTYYWGTHSPWRGPTEEDQTGHDVGLALRADTNERKPTGEIIKIVNQHLPDTLVEATRVAGHIRAYAAVDSAQGKLTLFLVNRNDKPEVTRVQLGRVGRYRVFKRWVFKGTHPEDPFPTSQESEPFTQQRSTLELNLPPLSLTVLQQ